jgi:hypothetical protein
MAGGDPGRHDRVVRPVERGQVRRQPSGEDGQQRDQRVRRPGADQRDSLPDPLPFDSRRYASVVVGAPRRVRSSRCSQAASAPPRSAI